MSFTLGEAIADFIQQRKQAKLAPLIKIRDKILSETSDLSVISNANNQYAEMALPIENAFRPIKWLTNYSKKAHQINFSTHSAKFTNGKAKASGVLVSQFEQSKDGYLNTACIKDKTIDASVPASALGVAKLLMLSVDGESLIDQLKNNNVNALKHFTTDEDLLDHWLTGFSTALSDDNIKSHNLNKQLYYPVSPVGSDSLEYHILCPLFPSTLAQELHNAIQATRFSEDSKFIRSARKNNEFHEKQDEFFPFTAIQNFGGSKPQNISLLNQNRNGKSYLLDCSPPRGKRVQVPPFDSYSMFSRDFNNKTAGIVRDFKCFLIGLTEADRNFKTRYKRDYAFIQPLIDELLSYSASVQSSMKHAGWSNDDNCKTKLEHTLFLDVYSPVPEHQSKREEGAWLNVIAEDFSVWLLDKLESDEHYLLGDLEKNYFKKICLDELEYFEKHTPKLGDL